MTGYVWVDAVTRDLTLGSNKRAGATVAAERVGMVTPFGELVTAIQTRADEWTPALTWTQYGAVNSNDQWWVRSDVVGAVPLVAHELVLDVPYRSQSGRDALLSRNDCGQASTAMLLAAEGIQVTVDEITRFMRISNHRFTTFPDNMHAVGGWGRSAEYSVSAHVSDILRVIITLRKPVFVLLYYDHLRRGQRYGHFLVVVGYRIVNGAMQMIVHDPYDRPNVAYAADRFARAIGSEGYSFNSPWQAMWIKPMERR